MEKLADTLQDHVEILLFQFHCQLLSQTIFFRPHNSQYCTDLLQSNFQNGISCHCWTILNG